MCATPLSLCLFVRLCLFLCLSVPFSRPVFFLVQLCGNGRMKQTVGTPILQLCHACWIVHMCISQPLSPLKQVGTITLCTSDSAWSRLTTTQVWPGQFDGTFWATRWVRDGRSGSIDEGLRVPCCSLVYWQGLHLLTSVLSVSSSIAQVLCLYSSGQVRDVWCLLGVCDA